MKRQNGRHILARNLGFRSPKTLHLIGIGIPIRKIILLENTQGCNVCPRH